MVEAGETSLLRVDGRHLRRERMRQAIIDACVALLQETSQVPTATEIADRARCSKRLVFLHFGEMVKLGMAVADQSLAIARAASPARNVDGDRATRIRSQVETRAASCERWLPLWRLAVANQGMSTELKSFVGFVRQMMVQRLELMYAPELSTLSERDRRQLLIALEAIADFQTWERMRDRDGLSVDEAQEAWRGIIDRMLPPTPLAPPPSLFPRLEPVLTA